MPRKEICCVKIWEDRTTQREIGEGDYLFAYGELLGCSGDMKYFSKHLKVNFDLVIQDGAIAKDILLNTKRILNDSNRLKKICIPAA